MNPIALQGYIGDGRLWTFIQTGGLWRAFCGGKFMVVVDDPRWLVRLNTAVNDGGIIRGTWNLWIVDPDEAELLIFELRSEGLA